MAHLDKSQRQFLIESLTAWLQDKIGDERNEVEFQLANGVSATFTDNLMQPDLAQNGTATLTVRINGGAQHTQALSDDTPSDDL